MRNWEYIEVVVHYFPDGRLDSISRNGITVLFEQAAPNHYTDLNSLGQEGWELVNVYPSTGWTEIYHFKLPVD